jgi:hypothetical protein
VDGKWNLRITLPEGEAKSFDGLPLGNADFRDLTWIGWCSMAQEETVFYLDQVKLHNQQ